MAGPRPREKHLYRTDRGGHVGRLTRSTLPGSVASLCQDLDVSGRKIEKPMLVSQKSDSQQGDHSLDFVEFMKPFWIKSQSIATWKWLSPISPWKMSSWPFTWSKVLQKRCRKVRERCGSPKMVWHCDTSVTYSQAQKTWQGWNSQLWPQQLGSWVPNQTSHQVILLFGVDLGWILKTPGFRNRCGQGPPGFQNHRISFRRLKESICPFGHSKRKKNTRHPKREVF